MKNHENKENLENKKEININNIDELKDVNIDNSVVTDYKTLEKHKQHRDLVLAMRVGELLTISGAEIRRVENTMERIIQTKEGNKAHCNCTPGSVTATVAYPQGSSKTMILRINKINTDFKKIIRLNELSRRYTKHELTCEEAFCEIDNIENMRIAPLYLRSMLNALCCSGFTFIFSPVLGNVIASMIVGFFAMMLYETIFTQLELSSFMQTLIASFILAVMTYITCVVGVGTSANYIILGVTTPLLPGVETINAVRDIVESDYLSAVSRILNALLLGSAIAVGVGMVYLSVSYFGG